MEMWKTRGAKRKHEQKTKGRKSICSPGWVPLGASMLRGTWPRTSGQSGWRPSCSPLEHNHKQNFLSRIKRVLQFRRQQLS